MTSLRRDIAFGFASRALALLMSLAVLAVIGRALSVTEFGEYSLLLSITGFLALIAGLGTPDLMSYAFAQIGSGERILLLRRLGRFTAVSSALLTLVLATPPGRSALSGIGLGGLTGTAVGVIGLVTYGRLSAALRTEATRACGSVRLAIALGGPGMLAVQGIALGLLMLTTSLTPLSALLTVLGASLAVAVMGQREVVRIAGQAPPLKSATTMSPSRIARLGLPLVGSAAIAYLLAQVDLWIVGSRGDPLGLGNYASARKIAGFAEVPLLVTNAVIPPTVAALLAEGDDRAAERVLRRASTAVWLTGWVGITVAIVGMPQIIGLVYGDGYAGSVPLARWLLVGQYVNLVTGSAAVALIAAGRTDLYLRGSAVSLVVAAVLFAIVRQAHIDVVAAVAGLILAFSSVTFTYLAAHHLHLNTIPRISDVMSLVGSLRGRS